MALAFVGCVGAGGAQEPDACKTVLLEFYVFENGIKNPCEELVLNLFHEFTADFWTKSAGDAVRTDDVQPVASGSSSAAGTLAQSETVPPVQPVALGGGSISVVGSDAGTAAITSLSVNPSAFFGGDAESVARLSRLTDFTVFFPVDSLDRDEDGDIDYFGFRLRVNFTGLSAGEQVWDEAIAESKRLLEQQGRAIGTLQNNFASMTEAEMRACATAIRADATGPQTGTVGASCGAELVTPAEEEYEAFRAVLDRARTEADSRYVGLDLRLDSGDPTLGAVENAEATAITAGLAAGIQFVGSAPDPLAYSGGIRGRVGVRYTDLRAPDVTSFALDGGLAFVMKRPVTIGQALMLSGGMEFRFGDAGEELDSELQSEFLLGRAALSVPVTKQTAITISIAYPLIGDEVSPTLTVSGDWRLLLPSLLPGG